MKRMNYSSITSAIRRIHQAKSQSDASGVPIKELLEQDRNLRQKLLHEREEKKQRRDFLKAAGGLGLGAGLMSANPLAFAGHPNGHTSQPNIAIVGAGAGGLRTAHRLMQYGIHSTIYEANTRIGGRMYSNAEDEFKDFLGVGRVVEWGGELISTEHTALRNLAHQLNLELEDVNKLSVGEEETYLIGGELYNEHDLLDEWVGGIYDTMKRAQQDAPWQPLYNTEHTEAHRRYDQITAIEWMNELGYDSSHWVHKLLLSDLVAEYGITEENSALNLIYLLGWNPHNSGGLPLAGTDERLHVVGGNDKVIQGMEAELVEFGVDIKTGSKLEAVTGDGDGYKLSFDNSPDDVPCDVLVMALPLGLVKYIDFSADIWGSFSPQKKDAIMYATTADNGKIQMEFSDRHWDMTRDINGREIHQAARAYSDPDKFISTWEGNPGSSSTKGILVNYTGGADARKMFGKTILGEADWKDVRRVMPQIEQIWPGISGKYTGQALVSNWWENPYSLGAFTSPTINTMTKWWGAQWETVGNMYFAGEAYDPEVWSYMDGAIRSGERTATAIHQSF